LKRIAKVGSNNPMAAKAKTNTIFLEEAESIDFIRKTHLRAGEAAIKLKKA
jgi:hypothetical protein